MDDFSAYGLNKNADVNKMNPYAVVTMHFSI